MADDEWLAAKAASGVARPIAEAKLLLFAKTRSGRTETVTDHVERITGRPPRSVHEFARDHAPLLVRSAANQIAATTV